MFDYFDFGPVSLLVLEKLGNLFELGEPLPNGAMYVFNVCFLDDPDHQLKDRHERCLLRFNELTHHPW